jgi:hypothetical protein
VEIEPKPKRVRAGQVITRTYQRLNDLAIDSVQDDEHIGMPDLLSDYEDQDSINGTPNFEVQDDGIIEYMHNITIVAYTDEIIRVKQQTEQIVPLHNMIVFSPADAMHTKYALEPIKICATKQDIDQYPFRLGLIRITEIGEAQTMMEMVKNEYLANVQDIRTDIEHMHMDPEFWY